MACGGLKFIEEELPPELRAKSHTQRVLQLAIEMMNFIENFTYKNSRSLVIKIGIHRGNCIFGILGYHKPQFSLIGDTVNSTSRHCTTGTNGNIILSEDAHEQVKFLAGYNFFVRIFYFLLQMILHFLRNILLLRYKSSRRVVLSYYQSINSIISLIKLLIPSQEKDVHMKGKGYLRTFILKKKLRKLKGRQSGNLIRTSGIFLEQQKQQIFRAQQIHKATQSHQKLSNLMENNEINPIIEFSGDSFDIANSAQNEIHSSSDRDSEEMQNLQLVGSIRELAREVRPNSDRSMVISKSLIFNRNSMI